MEERQRKGNSGIYCLEEEMEMGWEWKYGDKVEVEVEVNSLFVPYQMKMEGESSIFRSGLNMPGILRV
jgi:hypothetical protein